MVGIREFVHEEIPFLVNAVLTKKITIDATAVDVGNTGQTHILRAGLGIAHTAAASGYTEYRTGGSAGEGDVADYILLDEVDLKGGDPGADSADVPGVNVLVIGSVRSGKVTLQDAGMLVDLAKAGTGEGWVEFV